MTYRVRGVLFADYVRMIRSRRDIDCNGQFVDATDVQQCIAYLATKGVKVDVSAQGSASGSCNGGDCGGDANGAVKAGGCAAAPDAALTAPSDATSAARGRRACHGARKACAVESAAARLRRELRAVPAAPAAA